MGMHTVATELRVAAVRAVRMRVVVFRPAVDRALIQQDVTGGCIVGHVARQANDGIRQDKLLVIFDGVPCFV